MFNMIELVPVFLSVDVFPVREVTAGVDLKPSSSLSPVVQWSDLTAIQTQLQQQSQVRVTPAPVT